MKHKPLFERYRISSMVFIYFTVSALVIVLLVGVSMYGRMRGQYTNAILEENQIIVNQSAQTLEDYLQQILKLSDSTYYNVIKNADLTDQSTYDKVMLLYESQKERISNIAVFDQDGLLQLSVPAARLSDNTSVEKEDWFHQALSRTDIMHFSMPHVQQTFDTSDDSYYWVITFSRAVEILKGAGAYQGVLLMNLTYSGLEQNLVDIALGNNGYLYLVSSEGELIYHPNMQMITSGLMVENYQYAGTLQDGNYHETFNGKEQNLSVKTVGYTGWKLVGVTPESGFFVNEIKTVLFMIFIIMSMLFLLTVINYFISSRIATPIQKLEKSVNAIEAGDLDADIFIGGAYEIQHLGTSIDKMAERIQNLMNDIVNEHESKRRSEFDALQSQINPHFLYNTLDIIVWMIENEKKEDAVRIVTALGRFFRISLSRGRNIITVRDELEHVRNYLLIQQRRFKDKFSWEIDAPEEAMEMASLKLMLQPLAENAVYHGMEFMDGDGEIRITLRHEGDELHFTVEDNGLGMTREMADELLNGSASVPASSSHGSGIGVRNVNERIRLYFGEQYGLAIESEPDEGTKVLIRLPAIPYEDLKAEQEAETT